MSIHQTFNNWMPFLLFVKFHLGWKGRLNRLSYFGAVLMFYGGKLFFSAPLVFLDSESTFFLIIASPGLILMWMAFTSTIKRVHDMNKSGKWLTYPVFLPMPINFALLMSQQFVVVSAIKVIGTFVYLFGLAYLLFGSGTKGENNFGPDPRNEDPIDVLSGKFHRRSKSQ